MPLHGFAFEAVPEAPHLADLPLLEALHRALPEQASAEVVAATGAQEQRRRLLPARLVVALVVALGLWARDGLRDVLANLVEGLRERDPAAWAGATMATVAATTAAVPAVMRVKRRIM